MKKLDFSNYSLCETLFKVKDGSIFFWKKKKQKTIFDNYGPGVPLYFIFLRTIILFLLIASLFSFYMTSKNQKSKKIKIKIPVYEESYLPATTDNSGLYGFLGSYLIQNTLAGVSSLSIQTYGLRLSRPEERKELIELGCPSGTIATHLNLADFGLISSTRSSKEVNNIYNTMCNNWAAFFHTLESCRGKSVCDIHFEENWLQERCQNQGVYQDNNLVIKYHCASEF